jgi:hypothetical protein
MSFTHAKGERTIQMTNSNHALSDADLGLVSGGLRDRPETDYVNRLAANANRTGLGGSLGNVIPGIVIKDSGPNTPGHPYGTGT